MIHWSPTKLKFTLGIGSLASIALLSELSQKAVPAWLAVGIVILPLAIFVFADPDDIPHSIARFLQIGAAFWYLTVNSGLVVWFLLEHKIDGGWLLMSVFLAVGAIPCLIVIGRAVFPKPPDEESFDGNDVGTPCPIATEKIDTSRSVVYRPKIGKQLLFLMLCSAFVAGGLLMIHDGKVFGWLPVTFFGLGVIVFALQLLPNCSYLRLSSSGIEVRNLWRTHRYEWADISHFFVGCIGGNKMVLFDFSPSYHHARTAHKVSSALSGAEAGLPDTYGFTAEALAERLNQWMATHPHPQFESAP